MNDRSRHQRSQIMLPRQARPVGRGDWTAGPAHEGEEGIQAAQDQDVCSNLRGLAQQMCYAMYYGA
jgi:hypothetical protein